MQRLQNLEMLERRAVQNQKVAALITREPRKMLDVAAQVLREVMEHRPRCADGGALVLQPETVERCHAEMIAQSEHGGFWREGPILMRNENGERGLDQVA